MKGSVNYKPSSTTDIYIRPFAASHSRGTKPLESKSRTGTRQTKKITIQNYVCLLFVFSQCEFCSPELRFCTRRMASGKGPIITSLKKVAGQSRNKTRSHCQAGSSVKDKFLKYMRLKCCFALVICKIKLSIFRYSFNF